MSFNSAEARPTHRAAYHLVPILVALLLAWLSTSMNVPEQSRSARDSIVTAAAATRSVQDRATGEEAHELRSVFAASARSLEARSYHPAFQTSNSTGVLGFWMLVSLCALLLGAALAPPVVHWLWRNVSLRRSNDARHHG